VNKILRHISQAREWLRQAEDKLEREDEVEGELYLSLAEAEIHKAWENSMTSRQKKQSSLLDRLKQKNIFKAVMISALLCFIIFAGFNYYGSITDKSSLELNLSREKYGLKHSISSNLHRGGVELISNNLTLNH
jgi:hypothetical protein